MSAVWNWLKKEAVLAIAALCALVSALFVPPSLAYVDYLDLRVLCLLFCLMVVVAGFRSLGVFSVLAQRLLGGRRRLRVLALLLVFLPFFFSMFITNDVALIAFVPFALLTLGLAGSRRYLLRVVVLQTIAANLGSMLTPFGNPQNLYLYSYYQMSIGDFFGTLGLYTLASLVLLALCCLFFPNKTLELSFSQKARISSPLDVWLFLALFLVCLVSVLRLVHYLIPLALVVLVCLLRAPKLLKEADYSLLLTFVCFFVFSGNMGNIPAVQDFFSRCMDFSPIGTAILSSQIISNVPSAVLLSRFTSDGASLLIGTNLGGLGTLIASLASLISFRFYAAEKDAKPAAYLGVFTLYNLAFLFLLALPALLCA